MTSYYPTLAQCKLKRRSSTDLTQATREGVLVVPTPCYDMAVGAFKGNNISFMIEKLALESWGNFNISLPLEETVSGCS